MELGASNKRKFCHDDEKEEEEEEEEQKIEKFFALIKNIREARFRLMNGSDVMEGIENRRKKKKVEEEKKQIEVWKPSFQREDFMEDTEAQLKTDVGSSPRVLQEGIKNEDDEEELDLGLSL
ncbi:protein NIM1-INTERACTING 1-like [Fagus crenata]